MWKLMKLEWKKNNMKKYVGKAAVVTVIIFLMIFATSGELNEVETVEIYGKSMIGAGVDMFANMAFMLCTAAMLSYLITDMSFYINMLVNSAIMVSVSYTALLVGMRMKSSKAAIVAACIVMLLTQGNIGSFTLIYNIPFYTGLVVLSAISVFSCVHGVETRDVV